MPNIDDSYFEQLCYYSDYYEKNDYPPRDYLFFGQHNADQYLTHFTQKYNLSRYITNNQDTTVANLLRWTYEVLLHQDYVENTVLYANSLDMIEFSKANKVTLNCYCHAYIFRDALQSVNISARLVYCLPINCSFKGNHVVVEYYNNVEDRWILADPTYNIFISDQNNRFLSLLEFRNNIISRKIIGIIDNNRFSKIQISTVDYSLTTNSYISMMIPLLVVLQYENITAHGITQYRLIPKRYLLPKVSLTEDNISYVHSYTLLYEIGDCNE